MAQNQPAVPSVSIQNIQSVARLQEEFLKRRSALDRIADTIGSFTGSFTFVLVHAVIFATWFLINTGHLFGVFKFDPYPFILLAMVVSVEGVLLSTFVLMKQNRMAKRDEERDHLNLQIDLLAEKEITKILQLQRLICQRLGIEEGVADREAEDMSRVTSVDQLAEELRNKLS